MLILSLATVASWVFLAQQSSDSTSPKAKVSPAPIAMEAFTLKPGEPLSGRALVTRPAVLKDARGWTLETYRHRGPLATMSYHPDGKLLATGGQDGMIHLWDVETRKLKKILVGHSGTAYLLQWSPDGQHLASVGDNYVVTLWDTHSGHPLRRIKHKWPLGAIAWSPDGLRIAGAGGHSGVTLIWDATRGVEKHVIELGQPVVHLAWSPDGKQLAILAEPLGVQLYDTSTGKHTRTLGPPATPARWASWSPDGKLLASAGRDAINLWDSATGDLVRSIKGIFHFLEWSPDGKQLAAGYNYSNVTIFDPHTGASVHTLPAAALRLTWAPDGKTLATSESGTVSFWHATTGKCSQTLQAASNTYLHWVPTRTVAYEGRGNSVWLWDTTTCQVLHRLEQPAALYSWGVSRDGKLLACVLSNGSLAFWDTTKGEMVRTIEKAGLASSLSWSHDNSLLAGVVGGKSIVIWNVVTSQKAHTLEGHKAAITTLTWTGQGKVLASGGTDETVRLWDAGSGKLAATFPMPKAKHTHNQIYGIAASPGGKTLAVNAHEEGIKLLNPSTGKPIKTAKNLGGGHGLSWAPNGAVLASVVSGTTYLWNPKTGELVHTLIPWGVVGGVAWSPAATTLATSCTDSSVRIWDGPTGTVRNVLTVVDQQFLALSVDGHARWTPGVESELRYVVQLGRGQETLTPAEFAAKYRWKNVPANVRLSGK